MKKNITVYKKLQNEMKKINFEIICPKTLTLKVSFFNLPVLQMTKREK